MFFTKHDSRICPRCSCHGAHIKINISKKELHCYMCGYLEIKESQYQDIVKKPIYTILSKNKDEYLYENTMSSDLEWFINEYLVTDGSYLDLSNHSIHYIFDKNEIDIDSLKKELKNDKYHYIILFENGKIKLLSCGEEIKEKVELLKNMNENKNSTCK